MVLLASGSIALGISNVITQWTLAGNSCPFFSARTESPYLRDPIDLVSLSTGTCAAQLEGSCVKRAVFGPKHAAPDPNFSSAQGRLGAVSICWSGKRGLESLPGRVESISSCDLSVLVGLGSMGTSSVGLPLRLRRLLLFLPTRLFLALLVRPLIKGREVRLIWGLGLLFLWKRSLSSKVALVSVRVVPRGTKSTPRFVPGRPCF